MKIKYDIRKLMFIFVIIGLFMVSCVVPKYYWEYLLPDKGSAIVNMGDYEIELYIGAAKQFQKAYKDLDSGYIRLSLSFSTYYKGDTADFTYIASLPLISMDSIYIVQPPDTMRHYIVLKQINDPALSNSGEFDKYKGKWIGPKYGCVIDLRENQEKLIVGFKVLMADKDADSALESDSFKFELMQYYDRYWIMAD